MHAALMLKLIVYDFEMQDKLENEQKLRCSGHLFTRHLEISIALITRKIRLSKIYFALMLKLIMVLKCSKRYWK